MYYIKEYFKEGMLVILLLFEIFVFSFNFIYKDKNEDEVLLSSNQDDVTVIDDVISNELNEVRVDIKGAVLNPGVYVLDSNSCINDVISLAGGLKNNASTKYINLSKKVSDEMVIHVFTTSEIKNLEKSNSIKEECQCETIYINECSNSTVIEKGESSIDEIKNNITQDNKLISINTATKEELMTLNGIGEAKANAIIEYRNNNGVFKDINDIKNVSGISDNLYEKIKNFITL